MSPNRTRSKLRTVARYTSSGCAFIAPILMTCAPTTRAWNTGIRFTHAKPAVWLMKRWVTRMPDPTVLGGWYLMANMAAIILAGELVGWAYFKRITARDQYPGGE